MMAGGDGDGDAVFEPLTALCNIVRDPASGGLRIRIPEFANIALDTVSRHARGERAGALALVCEDGEGTLERFTYADLDAASDRLAVGLTGLGVGRGNAVAVHTGQSSATAIAHLAIYKLGAVVMTLSHLYGPDTVMHALTDSRVRVLISDPAAWQPLRGRRHELADLDHVIMSGAAEGDELALAPLLATDATGFQPVRTRADEPALLMYTSGSTGLPKGLMHAHRIIHAYLPTLTLVYNLELAEPGHVFWTPADWAWVGGLLDLVLPAWQCGQTVIASPAHRFEADWAFAFMARHRVSHAFMTPTALKRLAEVPRPRERWDLAVRVVCTGGESLPGDVVRWAQEGFGIVCNEFYGLTEFNHMVGCCKALYPVLPGSMGRAYPGRRVAIIDEDGNEQPDGTVGEIASWCPDEPTLFLGYRGAPGVPPHMRHGEWLRSGDLGTARRRRLLLVPGPRRRPDQERGLSHRAGGSGGRPGAAPKRCRGGGGGQAGPASGEHREGLRTGDAGRRRGCGAERGAHGLREDQPRGLQGTARDRVRGRLPPDQLGKDPAQGSARAFLM